MAISVATLIQIVIVLTSEKGLTSLVKSDNVWALDDCTQASIDLVFVADASVDASFDQSKPNIQMTFFSRMIDVFSPPSEETLERLRVSLMVAKSSITDPVKIERKIDFDSVTNKSTLKSMIESETITFEQFSSPINAIGFINLEYQKETINKLRADATLVIVMFGGHECENMTSVINDLKNRTNPNNGNIDIHLFMIVVKDTSPSVSKMNEYITVYEIPEITEHMLNAMPLLMCERCFINWFGGKIKLNSNDTGTLVLSCYRLGYRVQEISWADASEFCWGDNSQLASVETEHEQTFLSELIIHGINNFMETKKVLDSVPVYIGLQRQYSTVGRRFKWINANPLIFSNWKISQPQGGLLRRCVVWEFSNFTHTLNAIKDGRNGTYINSSWSTVGCGDAHSHFFVCENTVKVKQNQWREFKLQNASQKDFKHAIQSGNVGFISKSTSLMSLSSLLKNWKSEDKLSESHAYVNGNDSQTIPLSEVKLYFCEGNDGYIPYTSVCDFSNDCPDRTDELFCQRCSGDTNKCKLNDQCFSTDTWCDLYKDCKDGYDEDDCYTCHHGLCSDGRCLLKHFFADGEIDCFECGSNENLTFEMNYVRQHNIARCLFTCNRTSCVYESMLNNSFIDCQGIEGPIDETVGALKSTTCYTDFNGATSNFSNWGPQCIYILDIYGEPLGCRNMRHLQDCETFICPIGYYKCPHSYCIPTHYIIDGSNDCPHGEDEQFDQNTLTCPYYFRCEFRTFPGNLGLCLYPSLVCDGRKDCPEGDDELSCNVPCPKGFRCLAGTVIVEDYKDVNNTLNLTMYDTHTRYLDMSGIDLSLSFPKNFLLSFANLNEIKVSSCKIITTELSPTMCTLGTVRRLDLSYNNITNITPVSIFWCMRNLYYLNLSHNENLAHFQNNPENIKRLEILDLSYTKLVSLSFETFSALDDVRYLNLQNSLIADVSFLPETTIHILDLRGTPANNNPYEGMFHYVIITKMLLTDSYKLCCPQLHNSSTNSSACISTKDPFSSCSDLMRSTILRLILWTDGIMAVCGNLAVIIYRLFFDKNIFKMAYGHFVTHLGISDFLMGVYLLIIATADRLYRHEFLWEEHSWRHSTLCNIAGFISTLSIEVSSFFIFLITLDRYLVIRYPFGQFRIAGKIALLFCGVTWVIGSVIAMLPLLPLFQYLNVYNTNSMCLGLPLTNNWQSGREYAISVFIFFNCFMFILIAFGQMAIYKTVCIMRMGQGSLTNVNCRRAQDLTLAKKLALIVVTEFLCWFPIGVLGVMALCGYTISTDTYAWLAVLVLPINSAINPLLYTIPVLLRKVNFYTERLSSERSKIQ